MRYGLFAIILTLLLSGCSSNQSSVAAAQSGASVLYRAYEAVPLTFRQQAVAQFGKLRLTDYFVKPTSAMSDTSALPNGTIVTGLKSKFLGQVSTINQLATIYPTLADLWQATGVTPAKLVASDFADAFTAAELDTERGLGLAGTWRLSDAGVNDPDCTGPFHQASMKLGVSVASRMVDAFNTMGTVGNSICFHCGKFTIEKSPSNPYYSVYNSDFFITFLGKIPTQCFTQESPTDTAYTPPGFETRTSSSAAEATPTETATAVPSNRI